MELDPELEAYANLKYNSEQERINEALEKERRATVAGLATRGLARSGAMNRAIFDLATRRAELQCKALHDIWVETFVRKYGRLSREQVDHIANRMRTNCAANAQFNAPGISQSERAAASEELKRRLSVVASKACRDLEIVFREQELLPPRSNDRGTENVRHLNGSEKPLIFISCGQSTPAERKLGKDIAKLVEDKTGCAAYFAENQKNLEGVTENILKRLNEAVAFIAIMHPRGDVLNPTNPAESSWVRGSVWIEQEIAIAAFISQSLQRRLEVIAYVHRTIRREGLRDKLQVNPILFDDDSEILADLQESLPSWATLAPR